MVLFGSVMSLWRVSDRLYDRLVTVILQSAKLIRFPVVFHVFDLYPEPVDKVVEKSVGSL